MKLPKNGQACFQHYTNTVCILCGYVVSLVMSLFRQHAVLYLSCQAHHCATIPSVVQTE